MESDCFRPFMRKAHLAFALSLVLGCSSSGSEDGGGTDLPDSTADVSTGDIGSDTGSDSGSDAATDSGSDSGDAFVPCKSATDCATSPSGKACDTTTGKCVPCTATSDLCAPSEHCDVATSKCVAGCKADEGCATSSGDAGTDAVASDAAGDAATSSKSRCDVTTHTCVECTKDDQCAAGFLCVGNVCAKGCSSTKPCATGESCCAGSCVDLQTNIDNCGVCGTKCSVTAGTATCTAGACKVATCTGTLADCDGLYSNGCEVDKAISVANCGACGSACGTVANGTAACVSSACTVGSCATGYKDCDGLVANGCEVTPATDRLNCGTCGNVCPTPTNGTAGCASGVCGVGSCTGAFKNCDGSATNGCEVDSGGDTNNCGTCGNVCPTPLNATAACNTGACGIGTCNIGFKDCNGSATDGCEINTTSDVNNCGGCGTTCPTTSNATAMACVTSACAVSTCSTNFLDCDKVATNGCEIDKRTDNSNCGACGVFCSGENLCLAGSCGVPTSCKDLLAKRPTAPSGSYTIDPDGSGSNAPFDVYCDMTSDGGGWTLLMKLDGTKPTFGYSAAYWTNTTTLNPTSVDMTTTEAKFAAFNLLAGTDLRLGMTDAGTTRYIKLPLGASSTLYDRLLAGSYTASTVGRTPWTTLLASYSLQVNCNREGTNNAVGGYASVRIGILGNQEGDCGSPDSFIGFGAGPVACGGTTITTGNYASCAPDNGDRNTATFGYVFIR